MSNTLETDYIENGLGKAARMCHPILWEHSRKLERERDEARFLLKQAQSALDAIHLEVGGWIKIMKEKHGN